MIEKPHKDSKKKVQNNTTHNKDKKKETIKQQTDRFTATIHPKSSDPVSLCNTAACALNTANIGNSTYWRANWDKFSSEPNWSIDEIAWDSDVSDKFIGGKYDPSINTRMGPLQVLLSLSILCVCVCGWVGGWVYMETGVCKKGTKIALFFGCVCAYTKRIKKKMIENKR